MAVTLRYADGRQQAVFSSIGEAVEQAAHDENCNGRKILEIVDGTPDENGAVGGRPIEGVRAKISARAKARQDEGLD